MSKKHKQLKSPWDKIQSAVWMIGIAILFFTGDWWPGILFVAAASMIVEAVVQLIIPEVVEEAETAPPLPVRPAPAWEAPPVAAPPAEPPPPVYRTDLLPGSCPACGARVRENEVRWVSELSADCAYCGTPLIHAK